VLADPRCACVPRRISAARMRPGTAMHQ
jgi:hypothetical protein